MNNKVVADFLYQYADVLEAAGHNPYRIRAYRRAARVVYHLENDINDFVNSNSLTDLPMIGVGIAYTISDIIKHKKIPELKSAKKAKNLNELHSIPGLGIKRQKILNKEFGIYTKRALHQAIVSEKLTSQKWLTTKLKNKILTAPDRAPKAKSFLRLFHALPIVDLLLNRIHQIAEVKQVSCAGEFRRAKEIIHELVIIITANNFTRPMQKMFQFNEIKSVIKKDKDSFEAILISGLLLKVFFVHPKTFEIALLLATGNAEHLAELYSLIHEKKLNLNENGLLKKGKVVAQNEKQIYQYLGLEYITPELREGRGEIAAAQHHQLPKLIQLSDMKGDLHCHTNETDGKETLETMVNAAIEKGYEYVAITDHSKRLAITNGLDEKRLLQQIKQIDKLNNRLSNFTVLKSIEVDILEDGNLDLSNDVLKELDIVVASIHSRFKLPEEKQTLRILKAMDNPYFNILGHATGRLIKSRPPYPIDILKILQHAKERNCALEINAQPYRLDINDYYAKLAKAQGVKVSISSDAHSIRELNFMQLGVYQARRGWIEASDVLNTLSLNQLRMQLIRK